MSLLLTRELLAVAVVILAVVTVMLLLALTQARRRVRADARTDDPALRRGRRRRD
jgi:hypothetical protein